MVQTPANANANANANSLRSNDDDERQKRRQRQGALLALCVAASFVCIVAVVAVAVLANGLILTLTPNRADPQSQHVSAAPSAATQALPNPAPTDSQAIASPPDTAATAGATQAQINTTTPTSVPVDVSERQLRIFRQLWQIVNDRYIYADFNGYDWPGIKPDIEARIKAGLSDEMFYDLMRDLIINLNDDHSTFLSPPEAEAEAREYAGDNSYVGIGIYVEGNTEKRYIYVLRVYAGSPAEAAGVKPHDHILQIDGKPSVNEAGELQDQLMRGVEGTQVTLLVRTPGEQVRTVKVTRAKVSASENVPYQILPTALTGRKRIGYILIPTLFEERMAVRVRDALRALARRGRLDGLIVDMRLNGGGAYPQLSTVLGFFTRGEMGRLEDRDGTINTITVRAERVGNSQTVPLVVLIGPATASYAEVFAGSLQAKGRAKLVGLPSAGNIETLLRHDFEDGSVAWIAQETFKLPDGSGWEGVGLQPDVRVQANWDEFTGNDDPVIAAAVHTLTK